MPAPRPRLSARVTTACPSRCAPSTSRVRASRIDRAHRQRPKLPAQIPDQCEHAPARAAESARARQREYRGGVWRGHVGPRHIRNTARRAKSACSTTRCCASRPGAATKRCTRAARTPRELYVELRAQVSVHAARRNAARGRQRGIRRLVAAAGGRRRRGVHSAGGRRMNARITVFFQRRAAGHRGAAARTARRQPAADSRPSKAGCAITTKATRSRAWNTRRSCRARGKGRRAHRRGGRARFGVTQRRLRASRRFARRSATSLSGWA